MFHGQSHVTLTLSPNDCIIARSTHVVSWLACCQLCASQLNFPGEAKLKEFGGIGLLKDFACNRVVQFQRFGAQFLVAQLLSLDDDATPKLRKS